MKKKRRNINEMCSVSLTLALLLGANSEKYYCTVGSYAINYLVTQAHYIIPFNLVSNDMPTTKQRTIDGWIENHGCCLPPLATMHTEVPSRLISVMYNSFQFLEESGLNLKLGTSSLIMVYIIFILDSTRSTLLIRIQWSNSSCNNLILSLY